MSVEKKINYNMQGGVRNYLGKQKEVKAPLKWQSSPDHPTTELAYITQAEKDLLVKQDLHGSLKGGVNRGPSGILSLNGWGSNDPGQNRAGSDVSGAMDAGKDDGRDAQLGSTTAASTTMSPAEQKNAERVNATQLGLDLSNSKDYSKYHDIKTKGFFDTRLGKVIKTIGLGVIAPQLLAGTKVGSLYSGYNKAKGIANLAKSFNITDKNVVTSLADTVKDKFAGFNTTGITGPKGPPSDREGGDGNQQNALMSEYLLLLQKMEQGVLQKEEQARFNSLKSRLGKADGGIMNINMNKGKPGEVLSKLGELLYG
jgi:hypothetical protein